MQEKTAEQVALELAAKEIAANALAAKEQAAQELAEKRAKYPVIDGGVTVEMRQSWKEQNGYVMSIDVYDDFIKEHHIAYFRRPSMDTMDAVSAVSKNSEIKGANTMFKNCWLGGSPLLQSDAILKTSALGSLGKLFANSHAEIKNL